ncbi:hypothetical protein VTO73DRAFT_4256 [Trametes versicolor]
MTRVQDKTYWRQTVFPNGDTLEPTYASDDVHAIDRQVANPGPGGPTRSEWRSAFEHISSRRSSVAQRSGLIV